MTTTRSDPMPPTPVPNHHAHHPAFRGVSGLVAALSMIVGRSGDARVAMELAGVGADDRVVDVGSGPGVAIRRAARVASKATGVEPATVMRRVARLLTRRGSDAAYVEGTAEDLPLADGSATVIWSIATIHHWRDVEAGLAEARRALQPGGRLVGIERRVEPGATGHAGHGWTVDHATAFAEHCRVAGFDEVRVAERRAGRRHLLCVVARRI